MTKYRELTYKCKNCGFDQEYLHNLDYPQGRVTCQRCGTIIKRKQAEPRQKEKLILLANKYNTKCRKCRENLSIGQPVYWTPGKRGVLCKNCGQERTK